jgi:hypothetical protein
MTDQAPHREFGRRSARPVVEETQAAKSPPKAKPQRDPELAAWTQARAGARHRTWAICGLMVLGGPMSFLLPEGLGQIGGWGLLGLGALGLVARFRKPAKDEF